MYYISEFFASFFPFKKNPIIHHKIDDSKIHTRHMPKARRSTRNSDAMDAEGHEEVRRVFVFAVVVVVSSRVVVVVHVLSLCLPLFFFR